MAYIVPVFLVMLGVLIHGEELPAELYIALALILGGIAVSQFSNMLNLVRRRP